jgi:hypothetical protein
LGWTLDRWLLSTFGEFFTAVDGYWRNWERQTVWPTREILFQMIIGNPNIESAKKPNSSKEIFKIADDDERRIADQQQRKPSAEELEEAGKLLKGLRDKMK